MLLRQKRIFKHTKNEFNSAAIFLVWHELSIGPYRENAIAVRVIDRSAYDATSRVHAHRQRKNMSYLRNGCCIYYLRPTGSAHL